jgi:xanthosine utilization system XapX-like protein
MARRRKHTTLDEILSVGVIAGVLYLVLDHVAGTGASAAGYVAVGVGGVLVGLSLRPWADRLLRRFGVRVSYVGDPRPRTSGRAPARGKTGAAPATAKAKRGRP